MDIQTKDLIDALRTTALVIERRNTIPILSAILFDSNAETLRLRGTNLDQQLSMEVPTLNGSRVQACFYQPEVLAKLLAAGGGDNTTIETSHGRAAITCGQMSGSLGTLPADDHPLVAVSDVSALDVELGDAALDLLFRVAGAMSEEETRYYLNGVYFHHVEGWTWRFVATDGHRLYVANIELPNAVVAEGVNLTHPARVSSPGIIIPRPAIGMLRRLRPHMNNAPMRLRLTNTHVSNQPRDLAPDTPRPGTTPLIARFNCNVHGHPLELVTKLIDGTFPDYTRVIPDYGDDVPQVVFKRADLARALDGITAGMTEKSRAVALTFDPSGAGSLIVSAKWIDTGFDGKITIPATTRVRSAFKIGYNGGYLRALLNATVGDDLAITVADPASPGSMIDPDASDFRAVLMPMRI